MLSLVTSHFLQILYKNVAHPKLAAFIKKHNWVMESEEYLVFPQNQSEFKGGVFHYLESIEEVNIPSCLFYNSLVSNFRQIKN